jgi:hypothetical protein
MCRCPNPDAPRRHLTTAGAAGRCAAVTMLIVCGNEDEPAADARVPILESVSHPMVIAGHPRLYHRMSELRPVPVRIRSTSRGSAQISAVRSATVNRSAVPAAPGSGLSGNPRSTR